MIWLKCPKTIWVGRSKLEVGTFSGVLEFMSFSFQWSKMSKKRNSERIMKGTRKFSEHGKQVRKDIRAIKKGYLDKENKRCYVPGGF